MIEEEKIKDEINEVWNVVKNADRLASAIERSLLTREQEEVIVKSTYNVLINPFNPNMKAFGAGGFGQSACYRLCSTIKEVALTALYDAKRAGEEARKETLRAFVHSFISLLEPLYMEVAGTPSPADTRQPDHTVFDHVLATAALSYAMTRERMAVVGVKLGGFKDFVTSSRKLADAWIGSWLSSALVWASVKDYVWEHGPGSLLAPSVRWNQFYLALLKKKGLDKTVEILGNFYLWEGFPYYPTMPTFAILIIPVEGDEDEAELKDKMFKRMEESWERAVNSLFKYLSEREDFSPCFRESVRQFLSGIVDKPPFSFKVFTKVIENMNDVSPDRLSKELMRAIQYVLSGKEYEERGPGWLDVDWKYYLVSSKDVEERIAKGDPCVYRHSSESLWRLCSVCSKFPGAFIAIGKETEEGVDERYEAFAKYVGANSEALRPVFKPGERLCPYCLFKRIASLPSAFNYLAEELVDIKPNRRVSFPSLDDVAAIATKIAMLKAILRFKEKNKIDEVKEHYEKIYEILKKFASPSDVRSEVFEDCPKLDCPKVAEAVEKIIKKRWWTPYLLFLKINEVKEGCGDDAKCLKLLLASLLLFDVPFYNVYPEVKDQLDKIAEELEQFDKKLANYIKYPKRYVALVRFDADNGTFTKLGLIARDGKRIRSSRDVMERYEYVSTVADSLLKLIENVEEMKAICRLKDEALKEGGTRDVTPAYLSFLSAAMSYFVMRSVRLITELGGVVVYAAGDEGLAVLPSFLPGELIGKDFGYEMSSNQGINSVLFLRRLWWGSSSNFPGFYPVRKGPGTTLAYLPAMLSGGLSVGVRFSHHKDHLHSEIDVVEELLEKAKEYGDSVAFGYGRGSPSEPGKLAKSYAALRLASGNSSPADVINVAERVLRLTKLLKLIEDNKASLGLVRAPDELFGEHWDFIVRNGDRGVLKGIVEKFANTYARKEYKDEVRELLLVKNLDELDNLLRALKIGHLSER